MKLSKKVLATMSAAALLVTAGLFTSCSDDDDDPNDMISGGGNNYSIDYTNESTTETSRGIAKTALEHAGAAVKITIQNPEKTDKTGGIMGLMFDWEEVTGTDGAKTKAFDVVALRSAGATDGKIGYYVSRFENITDLQAYNFGATTDAAEGQPKETEIKKAFQDFTASYDSEKNETSVTVVALLEKGETEEKYSYNVYLLKDDVKKLTDNGKVLDLEGNELTLPAPVATIPTEYTALTEKKLCVYANVYATGTLKGTWAYKGDYKQVALEEN